MNDLVRSKKAEIYYAAILESTGEGLYGVDLEGRCTFINAAGARMLGYQAEELIGQPTHAVIHHSRGDGSPYPEELCVVSQAFLQGCGVRTDDDVLWRKDGSLFPVALSSFPHRDSEGRIIGAVVSFTDITERKQTEAILKATAEQMRMIFESATDALLVLNHEGRITQWNRRAEEMFGWSPTEAVGGLLSALLVPPRLREVFDQRFADYQLQCPGHSGTRHLEVVACHRDGHEFPVDVTICTGQVGAQSLFCGFIRDITHTKQLEAHLRQTQKLEALGRLSGGVAHDFNNLLTVINGSAHRLRALLETCPSAQKPLTNIESVIKKATALTHQLLTFGQTSLPCAQVMDMNTILESLLAMLTRIVGEDIILETELASSMAPVKIDPSQLEQVVVNLVVNARDAMPKGGQLRITTSMEQVSPTHPHAAYVPSPGVYACLVVQDTGHGMTPETINHIFEPFFTTKEKGKGTGLGLATVYGIVKTHQGGIVVESQLDRGTKFTLYWPISSEAVAGAPAEQLTLDLLRGTETILLVDDQPELREMMAEELRLYGYTVLDVANGQDAMTVITRMTIPLHLLVTDVVMPGMNGRELKDHVRLRYPTLPVLYISGYTDDIIKQYEIPDMQTTLLHKPFHPDTFVRKVRELLDGPPVGPPRLA